MGRRISRGIRRVTREVRRVVRRVEREVRNVGRRVEREVRHAVKDPIIGTLVGAGVGAMTGGAGAILTGATLGSGVSGSLAQKDAMDKAQAQAEKDALNQAQAEKDAIARAEANKKAEEEWRRQNEFIRQQIENSQSDFGRMLMEDDEDDDLVTRMLKRN